MDEYLGSNISQSIISSRFLTIIIYLSYAWIRFVFLSLKLLTRLLLLFFIASSMNSIDFDQRVLPSIVNEVTKAVVAQYNAAELLTKRDAVSRQIRDMLAARANDFRIVLDDVSITHLAFSKEYTAAVEAKQVAQQDSERAKYLVERAIQEKRTIIIKADGEAKSAELIGKVSMLCLINI